MHKWLTDPGVLVPGTRMPQFEYGTTIAPKILGGDGLKQREALVDYILSLGTTEAQPQAAQSPAPASP